MPLNAAGMVRAKVFAASVASVRFTHVFSSHTTRARQMVEPAAAQRGLPVVQLPGPGRLLNGVLIDDRVSSREAIQPLVTALRQLPAGSRALVGVNSDNIYAILYGLGTPVAGSDGRCALGSTCVPCLTNQCFKGVDQLWVLVIDTASPMPTLIELRYGVAD